jgi:hypothetical protein
MSLSSMHYRPWIGSRYEEGYRDGLRLLIMGLSHYGDTDEGATSHWTTRHIEEKPDAFWTHVEQVVIGRALDRASRKELWHRVAFSNFLQGSMDAPGDKVTGEQWTRGRRAFAEIVECTTPDIVFVFAQSAWTHMPDDAEFPGSHSVADLGQSGYLYRIRPGYEILAAAFNHPRNPGCPREVWHAWSDRVLASAAGILQNGIPGR